MNLYRNFFILKDKSNHSGTHQHETDKVFSDWSSLKKKIKCVELNNNNRKCIRGGLHKRRQNWFLPNKGHWCTCTCNVVLSKKAKRHLFKITIRKRF